MTMREALAYGDDAERLTVANDEDPSLRDLRAQAATVLLNEKREIRLRLTAGNDEAAEAVYGQLALGIAGSKNQEWLRTFSNLANRAFRFKTYRNVAIDFWRRHYPNRQVPLDNQGELANPPPETNDHRDELLKRLAELPAGVQESPAFKRMTMILDTVLEDKPLSTLAEELRLDVSRLTQIYKEARRRFPTIFGNLPPSIKDLSEFLWGKNKRMKKVAINRERSSYTALLLENLLEKIKTGQADSFHSKEAEYAAQIIELYLGKINYEQLDPTIKERGNSKRYRFILQKIKRAIGVESLPRINVFQKEKQRPHEAGSE